MQHSTTIHLKICFSLIFHGFSLVVVLYSFVWLHQLGLLRRFLIVLFTAWNLVCQVLFLAVALARDLSALYSAKNCNSKSFPASFISLLYHLLLPAAICMSFATTAIFWGLFIYDRELIHPRAFVFPELLNHIQHTFPLLVTLLELFVFFRLSLTPNDHSDASLKRETLSVVSLIALYLAMLWFVKTKYGVWPYPFMNIFTTSTFLLFAAGAIIGTFVVTAAFRTLRLALHPLPNSYKKQD